MKSTIHFYGGTGTVTGANFMLDTGQSKILVDCGLIQGGQFAETANATPFAYDPTTVNTLLVTHAHADHIGRIPKLVREGFAGKIYSTLPTKELAAVMFADALNIMRYEYERFGRQLIYEEEDIDATLALWQTVGYEEPINLPDDVMARFTDAGHILGSGMVSVERGGRKMVFTGDVGNVPQPLLNPPVVPTDYHYLLMESVYGDRLHEQVVERNELLLSEIKRVQKTGGTLIIPAFSLERTQALLFEINNFVETGTIKSLPVFLDSPLAIKVTEIYRRHLDYLKDAVQKQIKAGDDIFAFPGLAFTQTLKESNKIEETTGAKIIIAGSGMSHGGRIRRHEQKYLGDSKNTVLLVGYQTVGSLGRLLQDGANKVVIDDVPVKVRARIATIAGFSGHADRDQLLDLVAQGGGKAERVFVTMGEERASLFLVQRLRDYLGLNATAPALGESEEIDF